MKGARHSFRDVDGVEVREGSVVHFSYGIPPIGVEAPVISRDGELIIITEGHNPPEMSLRAFVKHGFPFWVTA